MQLKMSCLYHRETVLIVVKRLYVHLWTMKVNIGGALIAIVLKLNYQFRNPKSEIQNLLQHSPVHRNHLPGNVRRHIRSQKNAAIGYIIGFAAAF